MARVIIKVKGLQNNDLIGEMILSKTGRDKNHLYVVIGHLSDDYVILSNRGTKAVQIPKKRNLKHINVLEGINDEIKASITSRDRGADLRMKRFPKLKGIVKEGWLPYAKR